MNLLKDVSVYYEVTLREGAVILAHPEPDTELKNCHLLRIAQIGKEKVLAFPIGGSSRTARIIPLADIRVCGEEVELNREEQNEETCNSTQ